MNGAMAERIVPELEPQRHEHSLMSDGAESEQRGTACRQNRQFPQQDTHCIAVSRPVRACFLAAGI